MRLCHAFLALALGSAVTGCEEFPEFDVRLPAPTPQAPAGASQFDYGSALLARGDWTGADRAFRRSLAVEGISAAALSGVGVASEKRGLLTEAERFFRMAVEAAPESVIAHNNLGAVHYRLGNLEAARQSFRTAFALSSGTSEVAGHNLGLTERALAARAETEVAVVENPHGLQRLGSGEYRIETPPPSSSDG